MINIKFISYLIVCTFHLNMYGQSLVSIPNTEEWPLKSDLNKKEYRLQVALPHNYKISNETYHTLYLLDSNTDFPLLTSISRRLQFQDGLQKFILVGISYKEEPYYNRREDYTPTNAHGREQSGKGKQFLKVIESEIIPFIERNYKIDQNSRSIFGHSLGALFCADILLNESELFQRFVISSPSLWWDGYKVLEDLMVVEESRQEVFLSIGSKENPHMIESFNKLSSAIDGYFPNVKKKTSSLIGENHTSSKIRAYTDGLRWIFRDRK